MTTTNAMQLLLLTLIVGAFVSSTTYVVLSRVRSSGQSSAPQLIGAGGSDGPSKRRAAEDLASLIGLDASRIGLTFVEGREVHCSIQARPDELHDLSKKAEAAIDQSFRERHLWNDLHVILQLEART